MSPETASRPPAGIRALRRDNPVGHVQLAAIAEHRVSFHLSEHTWTVCRETGQRFARRHGDIDLTPARSIGGFDAHAPSTTLEVRLPTGFLQRIAEEVRERGVRASLATRHLLRDEGLAAVLCAMDAEVRSGFPSGRLYLDSLGTALAVRLLDAHAGPPLAPGALSATQVRRVTDYIEAHLDSELSLDRLAEVAGVSRSYLQRAFKARHGVSLHRYVVQRRVERARELLRAAALPAAEVALLTGFAHQSHMARWMRRLLGVTPRQL